MEKFSNVEKFIIPNTSLTVIVSKGNYRGVYNSRIEDFDSESVYITIPSSRGVPIPLKPGSPIEVSFINEKGRFSFDSVVIDRKKGKLTLLQIEKPEVIYRKELRRFFRVESRIKILVKTITYELVNDSPEIKVEEYDAHTKDISGGGLRIVTEAPLEIDQAVELKFVDKDKIRGLNEIFAKVVVIYESDEKTDAGLEFISIKESDRDKIIKYVFKRQIELRKMSKQ